MEVQHAVQLCVRPLCSSLSWLSNHLTKHTWRNAPHCVGSPWKFSLVEAWWCHIASRACVIIGSDNGLVPDGTKPLPEPMLIYHQLYSVSPYLSGILFSSCIQIILLQKMHCKMAAILCKPQCVNSYYYQDAVVHRFLQLSWQSRAFVVIFWCFFFFSARVII